MSKDIIINLIANILKNEEVFSDVVIGANNVIYISNYNEKTEEIETFIIDIKECENNE